MLRFTRWMPMAAMLALMAASPAVAQGPDRDFRRDDRSRIAYDNGYRTGFDNGARDRRSGQREEFNNDRDYRQADRFYERSYGDRDQYRDNFRRGYAAGYRQGYRDVNGRYPGRGGAVGRDDYRDDRGSLRPGGSLRLSPQARIAYDNGYRDGFEKGREDVRDRDRFDATRHNWYRDGDRHYESRYGDRNQYRVYYRDGFLEGYADGFRRR